MSLRLTDDHFIRVSLEDNFRVRSRVSGVGQSDTSLESHALFNRMSHERRCIPLFASHLGGVRASIEEGASCRGHAAFRPKDKHKICQT